MGHVELLVEAVWGGGGRVTLLVAMGCVGWLYWVAMDLGEGES